MIARRRWTALVGFVTLLALAGCGGSNKAVDLGGSTGDLTYTSNTGAIEARFVRADRSPFANELVLVSGTRASTNSISARTDAKGFLRLGKLGAGTFQLLAGTTAFTAPVKANEVTTRLFNLGDPRQVREDVGQLYVLNGLGKTLSIIETDLGTITNNAVRTGQWPNQVAFYKGVGFIVNSGDNNIQRFNPATGATIDRIDLGVGTNPYAIAFLNDKAYVSCLLSNTVQVINLAGGNASVGRSIDVGKAPEGMAVANGRVFVCSANYSYDGSAVSYGQGQVHIINGGNDTVEAILQLGEKSNPQAAAVGADGNVYVVCTGDYSTVGTRVLRINARSLALDGAALELKGEGSALSAAGTITVAPNGRGFIADPQLRRIHVIDTKDNKVLRTGGNALNQGTNPLGATATANGVVWVFDFGADQVRSISSESYSQRFAPLGAGDGPQQGGGRQRELGRGLGVIGAAR